MKERLLELTGPWSRKRVAMTIVAAMIGGAVAYVANVWIIARHYDGWNKIPADAPVAVRPDPNNYFGNVRDFQGQVLWFLITAIGAAVLTQLVLLGPRTLADKILTFPARMRRLFTDSTGRIPPSLMFGAASTLLLGGFLIPSIRGVLALGVLMFLPFGLGRAVVIFVSRILVSVASSMSRRLVAPHATAGTGIVGAGLGLMVGFLFPSQLRLLVAVVLIALAFYGSRTQSQVMSMFLLLAAAGVVIDWITPSAVLADDGGWSECGNPSVRDFFNCDGSEVITDGSRDSILPGACGAAAGSACGGKTEPPGPKSDWDGSEVYPHKEYDGDRLLWETIDTDGDGKADKRVDYTYDDQGRKTGETIDDNLDGKTDRWINYEYDDQNRVTRRSEERANGHGTDDYWKYNPDGSYEHQRYSHDSAGGIWSAGHGHHDAPNSYTPVPEGAPRAGEGQSSPYPERPDPRESADGRSSSGGDSPDTAQPVASGDRDGDGQDDYWKYDHDGDGVVDEIGDDTTGDGRPDHWRADTTGDGVPDAEQWDTTGDGARDYGEHDMDGDGQTDRWVYDDDGDEYVDRIADDTTGDGRSDHWRSDSTGDGVPDAEQWDSTGDGAPDYGEHDMDGDGQTDRWVYDDDGDQQVDHIEDDTTGDGDPDRWRADTTGDGAADQEWVRDDEGNWVLVNEDD